MLTVVVVVVVAPRQEANRWSTQARGAPPSPASRLAPRHGVQVAARASGGVRSLEKRTSAGAASKARRPPTAEAEPRSPEGLNPGRELSNRTFPWMRNHYMYYSFVFFHINAP